MWLLLSLGMTAVCFTLSTWVLLRPAVRAPRIPEDHHTMPLWWRTAWPWACAGFNPFGRLLSWQGRLQLKETISRAALPAEIEPAHIVSTQAVCGIAVALLTFCGFFAILGSASLWLIATKIAAAAGLCAAVLPRLWLRQLIRRRTLRIGRELPFVLDMTTLCVESGLNLQGALVQAAQRGPAGPLRDELTRALADMRTGVTRLAALKSMAVRTGSGPVRAWVGALAQAETTGISLGPILRAQAAQYRAERFQRAEQLAMEAPVKMLLPLIGCIFPCTFIILGFPIVLELLQGAL